MSRSGKFAYLMEMLWACWQSARRVCPNCGSRGPHQRIERKYMVTELLECPACLLRFRAPIDRPGDSARFYNRGYREGFTTDCPDVNQLAFLKGSHFRNHEKDFSRLIVVLRALRGPGTPLVCDFGCSWGYGSWQLTQAGYRVIGYEISKPRAEFASEKLGVRVVHSLVPFEEQVDIFFSNHVLEHVTCVSEVWRSAYCSLKPGGLFVAVTPNGGDGFRRKDPAKYHKAWGKVHPNMISPGFYSRLFSGLPYYLDSTPWNVEALAGWRQDATVIRLDDGAELLVVAKKSCL